MSVLHLLAAPAADHVLVTAAGYQLGSGRLVPTVVAMVGLAGVVAGGLAIRAARRAGSGNGRTGAAAALVAGLVSVVVGGLHAANSAGGPGTGNGVVGAVAAVALGVAALALGGLALTRSRRSHLTG